MRFRKSEYSALDAAIQAAAAVLGRSFMLHQVYLPSLRLAPEAGCFSTNRLLVDFCKDE